MKLFEDNARKFIWFSLTVRDSCLVIDTHAPNKIEIIIIMIIIIITVNDIL